MQIVIDIPEEEYKDVKKAGGCYYDFGKAIYYGTPLPKGHGRIADIDAAIKCIKDVEGEDAIWAISLIDWACSKRTLIEAEREVEE